MTSTIQVTPEIQDILERINLNESNIAWVKELYNKGIKIGRPYHGSGVEVSFSNDHNACGANEFDRFLKENGFDYSCSSGLSRVIKFADIEAHSVFFEKLGLLLYAGNLMNSLHNLRRR